MLQIETAPALAGAVSISGFKFIRFEEVLLHLLCCLLCVV
jgi:hypothetical protein